MSGPLSGVRLIDLTHALAGPYGTMLLADLGADVVKVEPPQGDLARGLGPYRDDDELRLFGGSFQSINRGKRSIVLDLKTGEGIDTLLALVADADALVESFSVGVMERLGVPYERLRGINPRLVYASTRGFGDPRTGSSPYTTWPGFDVIVQAMAGALGINGSDQAPLRVAPGIGDIFPGTLTALGVVSAVLHARQTGEGQYVDVAMYDGILALCERIVQQYSYSGTVAAPQGNAHSSLSPFDVVQARDGWITVGVRTAADWRRLCELIERPELIDHDHYRTDELRLRNADEVRAILTAWTLPRTRAEIVERLGGEVPVAPVNTVEDIFADAHPRGREMLVSVPHPGCAEPVVLAGQPIKFTATPSGVAGRAPLLDEHGDEIRGELAPDHPPARERGFNGLEAI